MWHQRWTWKGLWQVGLLGTLSLRAIGRLFESDQLFEILSAQIITWIAGSWLVIRGHGVSPRIWHAICASLVAQNLLIVIFGLEQLIPILSLSSVTLVASASFPVWLLSSGVVVGKSRLRIVVMMLAALAITGGLYERWTGPFSLPRIDPGLWAELLLLVTAVAANQLRAGLFRPRHMQGSRDGLAVAEEFIQTQNRLVSVGQLATGAVHGVKNALSAIGLAADWGAAAGSEQDAQRSLKLIRRNVRAAHQDLERLLGGMTNEDDGQVDVGELIQGAAESLRIAVRAEQATIELDLEPGLMVAIGSSDLTIAISNLVTNAAHAGKTSEATKIRIISHRGKSGKVAIDVIDNSGGMDAELAAAAFDLGASGEESTGVGLYLARSIIERATGKLTWRSIDGGSCFTIELPEA